MDISADTLILARRLVNTTRQTRTAIRSTMPAQIAAKTSRVRPNMNVSSSASFSSAPLCGGPSMTEVPGFRFALYPGGNGLLGSSDTSGSYMKNVPFCHPRTESFSGEPSTVRVPSSSSRARWMSMRKQFMSPALQKDKSSAGIPLYAPKNSVFHMQSDGLVGSQREAR